MKTLLMLMISTAFLTTGISHASELCFKRVYDKAHLAKNKKQVATEISLKLINDEASPLNNLLDVTNNREAVLNIKDRKGKTYVHDRTKMSCTSQDCSSAESDEGPFGQFTYSYNFKTSGLTIKLQGEDGFELLEQNTKCNDGLECDDTLNFSASDKDNSVYLLKEIPCSKVLIVNHNPA